MRHIKVQQRARLHAAMERALANDIRLLLDQVARQAAEHARHGRHGAAIATADAIYHKLTRAIIARCGATARAFIALTLDQLGQSKKEANPWDIASLNTLEWLNGFAAGQVVGITDTTRNLIRGALAEGESGGMGPNETAGLIVDRLGGVAAVARATTIARTETHTAANYGSQEAAKATALELEREWAAVEDSRTRPSHAEADGQVVDMEEPFSVGGAVLQFPGDPSGPPEEVINCRCTVLYQQKEA